MVKLFSLTNPFRSFRFDQPRPRNHLSTVSSEFVSEVIYIEYPEGYQIKYLIYISSLLYVTSIEYDSVIHFREAFSPESVRIERKARRINLKYAGDGLEEWSALCEIVRNGS